MASKLPIGIQGFMGLRNDGYVYVDKTEYIYDLAHNGKVYFLSRPRRFGKSLLLSAMKYYWEGKEELFRGLKIEKLEENNPEAWTKYPVFYFDFNGANYNDSDALECILNEHLDRWEEKYDITPEKEQTLGSRFRNLIIAASNISGLRCVILVDEYDKPLMEAMEDKVLLQHNKGVYKGFFSTLKGFDEYLQFVFITGVTKFHKVSIFSDLNQLRDISMNEKYAGICGITESEMKEYFADDITEMADKRKISKDECLEKLKKHYDGYYFHQDGMGVYNPFSLFNAFADLSFGSYWFETGTPTFLINRVKDSGTDLRRFTEHTIYANERTLKDYTGESTDLTPLLYQTGYLTISGYDSRRDRYILSFPNEEVKYGFLESLLPAYVPKATSTNGLDIFTLDDYIENGDLEKIRDVLTALFAGISYTLETDPFEHYFQAVIYLVFTLLGRMVQCEMHTFTGRIDCKVETDRFIYLFEFKRDGSAEDALKQIEDKSYDLPFKADNRKIYKIGVNFDSKSRTLEDWKVSE